MRRICKIAPYFFKPRNPEKAGKMNARQIIAYFGLTLVLVIVAAVAWEYLLEDALAAPFRLSFLSDRYGDGAEVVLESLLFVSTALIVPSWFLFRSARAKERALKALNRSEGPYRNLVELSPDAIVVHRQGVILYANPAAGRLFAAKTPEILIGARLLDFINEQYRDDAARRMSALWEGEENLPLAEMKLDRLDGRTVDINVVAGKTTFEGEPAHQSVFRDISKRKKAERALDESERRFAKTFHSIPSMLTITDIDDGTFIDVNEMWLSTMGYHRDEVIGKTVNELKLWAEPREQEQMAKGLKAGNSVRNFVTRFRSKEGNIHDILLAAEKIELGGETRLLGAAHDITDLIQAEEAVSQFKTTLDRTLDCVFMFGPESLKFFYVNRGAMDQVGYSFEEMMSMTPADIKPEYDEAEFRELIAPLIEGPDRSLTFETVHQNKDGGLIPVEIFLQYVAPVGEEPRFVAIIRDINERKKTEKALIDSEIRLRDFANVSSDWLWEMGPDLKFTYFSSRVKDVIGINPKTFIGKSRRQVALSEGKSQSSENIEANLKDMEERRPFRNLVYSLKSESGETKTISINGMPIFGENGAFLGYRGTGTDLTETRAVEARAEKERTHLVDAVESIPEGFVLYDRDGKLILCNSKFREIYQYIDEDLKPGVTFDELVQLDVGRGIIAETDTGGEYLKRRRQVWQTHIEPMELQLADGRWIIIRDHLTEDGSRVGIHTDISIRKMVEDQFKASERQLRDILEASPIAVGVTQVGDTTLIFGNSRLAELFGIAPADLIGCDATELMLNPEEHKTILKTVARRGNLRDMEVERTRQDGSRFSVLLSVDIIQFEGKEAALWWAYDITEQKHIRAQLAVLAHRDTLTGLANRRLFQDHLSHALARARRKATIGALLYVDLDGFKQVNDNHGHEHGDWVLTEIARRITACVRESDLVARVGGDEFILVLEESHEPEAVEAVAAKVLDSLALPFVLNGDESFTGASIGIAYFGAGRITPDLLIHQADLAMYRAKRAGRGRHMTFDAELDDIDD